MPLTRNLPVWKYTLNILIIAVIEQLESDEDKQQWTDALQQLEDLGMDEEVAEKSLKRAFGWSSQAYWWKEKVKEVPQSGEVCNCMFQCMLPQCR